MRICWTQRQNFFDMSKFEIKVFRDDGTPVTSLDAMPIQELKQIRFELLVAAGQIKQRIYDLTGEELF